jgi:Zn-dependent peptidase ImmA (M78 family)
MKRSIIAQLRDQVPIRPLGREEALRVAERQAQRLLALSEITEPPVPESMIERLPRMQVERISPLPISGSTYWSQGRWLVVLNGSEPHVRQRFSLAHELKHVIDHPFYDVLFRGFPDEQRHIWIEQVCDFFAGCVLMPRPWVKHAWTHGIQRLPKLAAHFGVSQAAMQVRLHQIGLVDPYARCSRSRADWTLEQLRQLTGGRQYHRSSRVAVT